MQSDQLIGRREELEQLQQAFETARGGHGGIVLLSGEAGLGKTRLAEEALADCAMQVFSGRAPGDSNAPYGPVCAVLRDYRLRDTKNNLAGGSLGEYLSLLLPELGQAPEKVDSATLNEALIEALSRMAAQAPAVLFLDDLHWADQATLEFLLLLDDRLRHLPLMVLGTYRSDEMPQGHRLRWLRHELRRRRRLNEISLQPFNTAQTALLLESILGETPSAELVSSITKKTQGIALFIEELAAVLRERNLLKSGDRGVVLVPGSSVPMPESLRDAILLKMDGLSEEARRQLDVAAVLGVEPQLQELIDICGHDHGLNELLERGLLIEKEGGKAVFRHNLTREAVYGAIGWTARRGLNSRVAQYLESKNAAAQRVAEHWLEAQRDDKARYALMDCARHSCTVYAYGDAAGYARRALDIWPPGEDEEKRLNALQEMAHCAQISGQLREAAKALSELLGSKPVQQDKMRLAETLRALATVYGLLGVWEDANALRLRAAEAFEQAGDADEAAEDWLALAARHTGMNRLEQALQLCDRAMEQAEAAKNWDVKAKALALKGNVLSILGRSEEGLKTVNAGLSLALEQNLTAATPEVYRRLGSTLEYASRYKASREAYFTAINYCENQGEDALARLCLSCMSYVLFRTGEWKQALAVCRRVAGEDNISGRGVALATMGLISAHRGENRQAQKYLGEALELSRRDKLQLMEPLNHWGQAILAEQNGEADSAFQHYLALLDWREKLNDAHDTLPAICAASTFFANNGKEKELAMCISALSEASTQAGNAEVLATITFALGESAMLNKQYDEAQTRFEQALAQFEKLAVPLEQSLAHYRLGLACIAEGDSDKGLEHLRSSQNIARSLGCRPRAAEAAAMLKKHDSSTGRSRNAEAEAETGLTSRQIEIAHLIAGGLTNKEIADKLFLSPRTVEMHVANLLNRLDCRSRSEAVAKAGELGLLNNAGK